MNPPKDSTPSRPRSGHSRRGRLDDGIRSFAFGAISRYVSTFIVLTCPSTPNISALRSRDGEAEGPLRVGRVAPSEPGAPARLSVVEAGVRGATAMKPYGAAVVLQAAAYGALHELGRRWGATSEEVARPMPGDEIVPHAQVQTTHAITIDAGPERVWPWLVQMGYHRAGWYTYPWVDRYLWHIENPSADQIGGLHSCSSSL
jgi:hypothetical protein